MQHFSVPTTEDKPAGSPAAERNKGPILEVLREVLPPSGLVLEIASGSGQHAVHFARNMPNVIWRPSDPSETARRSIAAQSAAADLPNLRPPLALDVCARPWPIGHFDALVCINMIHIAPWAATEALLSEASANLPIAGVLYLYGPFSRGGRHSSASNEAFDASLRSRDPSWGIRDLDDVIAYAEVCGLSYRETVLMPANNLSIIFERKG